MTDDTILTVTVFLAAVLVLALYGIVRNMKQQGSKVIQPLPKETTAEHMKRVLGPAQTELQQRIRRVK